MSDHRTVAGPVSVVIRRIIKVGPTRPSSSRESQRGRCASAVPTSPLYREGAATRHSVVHHAILHPHAIEVCSSMITRSERPAARNKRSAAFLGPLTAGRKVWFIATRFPNILERCLTVESVTGVSGGFFFGGGGISRRFSMTPARPGLIPTIVGRGMMHACHTSPPSGGKHIFDEFTTWHTTNLSCGVKFEALGISA